MGYRTTIIFNNDHLDVLDTNKNIGPTIKQAVLGFNSHSNGDIGPIGCVVEQSHADVVKLVILGKNGSFSIDELAENPYNPKNLPIEVALLKKAADKLGYYLVKRPTKKIIPS